MREASLAGISGCHARQHETLPTQRSLPTRTPPKKNAVWSVPGHPPLPPAGELFDQRRKWNPFQHGEWVSATESDEAMGHEDTEWSKEGPGACTTKLLRDGVVGVGILGVGTEKGKFVFSIAIPPP